MNGSFRPLLFAGLFAGFATSAQSAAFSTFSDRSTFEAALSGFTTETFNSYTSDTSFNGVSVDVGDFVLNATATGTRNIIDALPVEGNGTAIDGTTFLSYFLDGTQATIVFDTAITAVGFDIFAFGNVGNVSSIAILDGLFDQNDISGAQQFWGVTSDTAFTTITFQSEINDGFSVDNITYGDVNEIPVPAGLPLMIGALAAFGWMRRRR